VFLSKHVLENVLQNNNCCFYICSFSVTLAVKTSEFARLGPPHGQCSKRSPFGDDEYQYTLLSCQKMCAQKAVVETCGCLDINLPGLKNYPDKIYCANYEDVSQNCQDPYTKECEIVRGRFKHRIDCARNVSREAIKNTTSHRECQCYPPCEEIKYDILYSLAKWPADSVDGEEALHILLENFKAGFIDKIPDDKADKREMYTNYFNLSNRHVAKKQFSKLTLYVSDSNVLRNEETEDYPQAQLLSDIGGQLGLWMGISVISLLEVMQLMVNIGKYLSSRSERKMGELGYEEASKKIATESERANTQESYHAGHTF
jgi:hypothetical protein